MTNKKATGKRYFLLFGLCSLLALSVCLAVLVVTVRSVDGSNSSVVEYETQSKTELTNDPIGLAAYLSRLTKAAADSRFIKADIYTDVSVDDSTFTVESENSETDKALLLFAKNKMLSAVDAYYPEDIKGTFGEIYDAMPLVFVSSCVKDGRFSAGQADENGNPVYNTDTGELIDADSYFVNLSLDCSKAQETENVSGLFSLRDEAIVGKLFKDDIADECEVTSAYSNLTGLNINAKINRFTDEIEYLTLEKIYTVKADVSFIGKLEFLGKKSVSFSYCVTERLEYSYAGISFAETSVTVEPGSEIMLSVAAVIENDSDYTVTFSSSDESVATVDEMGYVKGIKASCEPVTVTVELEYLGSIFTDECTVTVNDDNNPNG